MVIEQTMDATRRMLLKQNKIDYDEDKDLFPTEDFDILTLESMLDSHDSENLAEKPRKLRNGNPVSNYGGYNIKGISIVTMGVGRKLVYLQ